MKCKSTILQRNQTDTIAQDRPAAAVGGGEGNLWV
jgi:hypothetical protein